MSFLRKWAANVEREISAEGLGWFAGGGWTLRQLKGLVILLPVVPALLFPYGPVRNVVLGVCGGAWFVWQIVTWAVGEFFFTKKLDRNYDRKVRPDLSKNYRKR